LYKLLSYEYLLEPIPGPPGQLRLFYVVLALGTGLGLWLLARLWREHHTRPERRALLLGALLALVALFLLLCAWRGLPYLSMRLLVFGSSLLALLDPLVLAVRWRDPLDWRGRHTRALSGQWDVVQPPLPLRSELLLLGLHGLGLLLLVKHFGWPMWSPVLLLDGLLSPQVLFCLRTRRWRVHLEPLAPLLVVYAVLLARLLLLAVAKLSGQPGFALPSGWDAALNVNLACLVAWPWSLLSQLYAILRHQQREGALLPALALAGLLLSLLWAGYTYIHHRTRGVTGSDPYGYAQMAVDLAEHGLPVHVFPLVARMEQLGVFAEAGVHLGYHLPFDASGRAATVWPVGQSVLLAIGYRLAGEAGLYLATPLLGLLSLLALLGLSWQLLQGHALGEKCLASALAVFLLATSYAQIERLVVPMADAAAQLFTTLTVVCWLRAVRPRARPGWAGLAGLSFAAAYWVRHTQIVLAASVLLLVWAVPLEKRRKVSLLACFALAAGLAALPDLFYHRWVMGHWLHPESLELRHFSLAFVGRMAWLVVRDLLQPREFLYLGPLVLYGAWRQARQDRVGFGLLGTWLLAVLAIHLPYEALRLRNLLSVFPVLCFWAGYGAADVWGGLRRWLQARARPAFLPGLAFAGVLVVLLLARTGFALQLPRAPDFDAFGHLNAFQRAGCAQIGRDTEETALIGVSLNSGSVELHSGRTAFRPAVWSPEELYTFADDALGRAEPVYLLEDGLEMAAPLAAARQRYDLQLAGRYDIPFYYTGGGSTGGRIALYRLQLR
jgi:hypothetical protein